jgi:hypothetical protein
MPSYTKENRFIHFQEALGPLGKFLTQSGTLEGMAKLEAASQPSQVAHELSEKEKYLKASDLLFRIYYGDKSDKKEVRPASESQKELPKSENILLELIRYVGCMQLSKEFQTELDSALKSGDSRKMELASSKLDMLQQLMTAGKKQASDWNKVFFSIAQGLAQFQGSSLTCDDYLTPSLSNLPATSWKNVPSFKGQGEYQGKELPVTQPSEGNYRIALQKPDLEAPESLNEVQKLDREIYAMCMELKLLEDGKGTGSRYAAEQLADEIQSASRKREMLRHKR